MSAEKRIRAPSHRRRARLFLLGGAGAFVFLTAILFLTRATPAPYVPGTEAATSAEITRTLERSLPDTGATAAVERRASGGSPVPATTGPGTAGSAADGPRRVRFVDAAEAAGIRFRHFAGQRSTQLPEDMGSGAAWGDYDGDGDPDLFLVNEAGALTRDAAELARSPAHAALYRNDGGGSFSDVTEAAGLAVRGWGMGAAWADADGDGDLDLFVTRFGTNLFFRNGGNGTFSDVTDAAGLGRREGFWTGASWADYDRDGDLDLYVTGYVRYESPADTSATKLTLQFKSQVPFTLNPSSYPPERNLLFRNDDGSFKEVAREAGVDNPAGRSLSAAWCDFDGDGWPDLYVANDVSDNAMFHNRGDGRFRDISHSAWVADYRGAMGLGIGDSDNDGDFDVFVTHWIAQENALYVNERGRLKATPEAPLRFVDQADVLGLGQVALDFIGWGTGFFDYDNDGRLDLFVANGSTFQQADDPTRLGPMRNQLFWNAGDAGFYEVGAVSGESFAIPNVGRGAAFADYDGDGDLDVVVVVHGGAARLLRNDGGNTQGWLRVVLRGAGGPRRPGLATTSFATGARVTITTGSVTQVREIGAGSSYLSQSPPGEAFFGVGRAAAIDRLDVAWPSGATQSFHDVPARTTVSISEGSDAPVRMSGRP